MDTSTVTVTILREAYEACFGLGEDLILSNESRWSAKLLNNSVSEMRENGLIVTPPGDGNYRIKITPLGILRAEESGAASNNLCQDNLEIRRKACEYLVDNETRNVSRFDLEHHTGFNVRIVALNLQVLELLGHIKLVFGNPRITSIGRMQVAA